MATSLDRAVEPVEIVQALRAYKVTQADVARAVRVTPRAVRGWKDSSVRPENYDRLTELRDLVVLLSDSLSERGVGQWLHAKNRLLDGVRPIDAIAEGRYEAVHAAAEAFVDGNYV